MPHLSSTNVIHLKKSANVLWCDFQCIQSEALNLAYRDLQKTFIKERRGEPWARVVNLLDWEFTMKAQMADIAESLRQDVENGLSFEAVVLPKIELGKWIVDKILQETNLPDVFHTFHTADEALTSLGDRGWDTEFAHWQTLHLR